MMSWGGGGQGQAWQGHDCLWGGFGGDNPSKILPPPSPLQDPISHMQGCRDREFWVQPKPCCGFFTYFWGRHMEKAPLPPY